MNTMEQSLWENDISSASLEILYILCNLKVQ